MKVLLSGATGGTNFGDFLFAKMFQEYVSKIVGNENVYWNNIGYHPLSEFYAKYLNYNKEFKLKEIDVLVYISGGYFCGADKCLKDYIYRFLRYFYIGILCIIMHKPYAIIAVEAARSNNRIIDLIQRLIIKKANIVVVRNQPSMLYIESILGKNNDKAFCTADSVFAMEHNFYDKCVIPKEIETSQYPKLFLHCNPTFDQNQRHFDTIIPIVNKFLKNHPDYQVIISTDQYYVDFNKSGGVGMKIKSLIHSDKTIVYSYNYPVALCKVIDRCNVVVTTKLHVGIVAALLGKSIISFSGHTKKIKRLYEQLNLLDRTVPLSTLTVEEGAELLEKYYNSKVRVPEEIITAAKSNFAHLAEFIESYNK